DYQQDMQLPFKTLADISNVNVPVILPTAWNIHLKETISAPRKYSVLNDEVPVCRLAYRVFQPPRA
ncbi:hypothetical protein, partial [Photobacterium damselae]|uniref:hypothetical protein n=1 Tax=Photobacterium damselae TaxID=38293 RepID=UPI001C4071C3